MDTSFNEIYRLFLLSIQDYNIKNMFNNNIEVSEDMLETFLIRSIPKFYNCIKNIKDVDPVSRGFKCVLDIEEKNILSELMVCSWLDWVINDIRQMNLHLNDND